MTKRKATAQERAEYERRMESKKRQMAKQRGEFENPAKSYGPGGKKGKNGKSQRPNRVSRTIGIVIAILQAVASVALMGTLFLLNMLPAKYLAAVGVMLLLLFAITLVSQLFSKKKGAAGKVFGILMTALLLLGTFYLNKVNSSIDRISGGDYKVDNMVVAVLSTDPAETIADAKDYSFGVQYAMGGDDVRSAVAEIGTEVGGDIAVTEYAALGEQAQALHDGSVQAIIYNEGYTGILEEAFEDYSNNVKIIYTHKIKKAVENTAVDVDVNKKPFSVFISGIDVYGAIETNSRSDVNIIATVNPATHQVLLVTTPRDYYVEFPGITGGQKDKLTHAGIYGVDASMQTLGQLYDMNIDFYARVNFTSLEEMVDVLGGVDVNSALAFTTSSDSGLVMDVQQGINHFDGKQALAFSRERQNLPDGDNQRGKNQQAVITAMIKKMLSPAMLVNANQLMNSVSGNVETNMSSDQIQALVKQQLSEGGSWNIKSMAAEGAGDTQYCYSYAGTPLYVTQPDQASVDAVKAAIDRVENGEILEDSEVAE